MLIKRKPKEPLEDRNIQKYINENYAKIKSEVGKKVMLDNFMFLRQADFNEKLNCSLSSITACVNFYTGNKNDTNDIYKYTRKIAFCFLYTPNLIGTIFASIAPIYSLVLRKYKVFGRQHVGLIKGLGFNKQKIINAINAGHPVILSLFRDGRGYYKKHTVTVVGYRKCEDKLFLILNDNWSNSIRYLDYQKLWILSAVNYY